MSNFYLVGDGWDGVGDDREANSCILIKINAGGHLYTLGTMDVEVYEVDDGRLLHFQGGIIDDVNHTESVNPYSRNQNIQSMRFSVMGDFFPLVEIRRSGIILQDIDVDVYWYVTGKYHSLEQAFHLLKGKIVSNTFDEEKNAITFSVQDNRLTTAKVFPPAIASSAALDAGVFSLDEEFNGWVYPFVLGVVKKVPVLRMTDSTPGNDRYIIMLDNHGEFSTGAVTNLYEGDVALNKVADGYASDTNGIGYWYQTSDTAVTTKDFSADVTGHANDSLDQAISYLLRFFSDDADIFDLTSLDVLKIAFKSVNLGFVVNTRVGDGALGVVRNRLSELLPFALVQRSAKYAFLPLLWDHHVTKHLSTERNIFRKTSGPSETPRANIYNSFLIKYGLSGFRGDFTGAVVRDFDDSEECDISKKRYGERVMPDVNGGDLADLASASWLMTWLIETYSKMRVHVSYLCSLDVVDVQLWDTVSVEDLGEGWTHRPLFKVVGIHRGTGASIQLDLISLDDYVEVYAVNQPIVEYDPVLSTPITAKTNYWYFDGTGDYLTLGDHLDFEPGAGDYSIVAMVRGGSTGITPESLVEKYGVSKAWHLQTYNNAVQSAVSDNGVSSSVASIAGAVDAPIDQLLASTYDYNPGAGDNSILTTYAIDDSSGTQKQQNLLAKDPVYNNSEPIRIAARSSGTLYEFAGRIYWVAWFKGTKLTQTNLEELQDGTITPESLNPTCYINFDRDVAATYESEVGGYVFTVAGNPVKNGP